MTPKWTFEGWVYNDRTGRRAGPVPTGQLRELIARGEVQHTQRVWRQWGGIGELLIPTLAKEALTEEQPSSPF
jgi:GYF domain 2